MAKYRLWDGTTITTDEKNVDSIFIEVEGELKSLKQLLEEGKAERVE